MKNFIRSSTTWITLITFLCPYGAFAELAAPSANASNAPASVEDTYCDSVCPALAGSNGSLSSLSGSGTWSTADDQWCANHGAQTNPSILPIAAPLGSTVPTEACPGATYYPGDTSCAQVTSQLSHCQYQNSQVESYCQAYESAKMAGAGEDMVFLLDMGAAGVCGAVCVQEMTAIGPVATTTEKKVCDDAAMAAGTAETLVTLTQQASAMGKIADAALGVAGIAEGALGWQKASQSCRNNGPVSLNKLPLEELFAYLWIPEAEAVVTYNPTTGSMTYSAPTQAPIFNTQNNTITVQGANGSTTTMPAQGSTTSSPVKKNGCAKAACVTAVTMAALAGIRYYNNGYGKRTKASACNNIWNLQSSAAAIGGGVAAAGYTASGGSLGATSSGSSVGSTSSGTAGTVAATSCVASGGTIASCSNGQISAATDGGILGNSGLGQLAAPLATQLAQAATPTSGSAGPGGAMGSAMGGAGDLGNVLTKVADTAAANGKELAQVASMGTGGGGGGSASDAGGGGLGSLFQGAGPTAATAPVQAFKGDGEESNDIYHSHTDKNIFQIISGRIEKSGSRVNF